MLKYIVFGSGLAFTAVIQPGPLQAYLLARVAAVGWRRTLPACLSPLVSDCPIAVLSLFLLGQLSPAAQQVLRGAGGLLLLFFAFMTLRRWRRADPPSARGSVPHTVLEAAAVNLLNPNPYLGWTLVLGPTVLAAWRHDHAQAVILLVAFYGTMILLLAAFIGIVGTARVLGPGMHRTLLAVSGVLLALLGATMVAGAVITLGGLL